MLGELESNYLESSDFKESNSRSYKQYLRKLQASRCIGRFPEVTQFFWLSKVYIYFYLLFLVF